MPKGTTFDNQLLQLIFNGTTISNIANNASSSPLTNLYLALHTADPTSAGSQTSSETSYTNYTRVAVARSSAGWTVASNQVTNAGLIQFPQCGASGATITNVSIGANNTGAGEILYTGSLSSPLTVSNLIQPQFAIGALTVTET